MIISRRNFVGAGTAFFAAAGLKGVAAEKKATIQGFDERDAGKLGAITYCEGEYFHPGDNDIDGIAPPLTASRPSP